MAVRATISKGYIWRPGVIGAMMLIFSGWFLYDGTVKYPRQERMWEAYSQIMQDNPGDPNVAAQLWAEHAAAEGWPTTRPEKREINDKFTQKVLAAITAPVGLFFMWSFLSARGRWVEVDEQAVRTSRGQVAEYDSISSIDKSRWQRKGIAVIHYGQDGTEGRIVLDDWKFEREPTKRILSAIEERMPGGGGEAEADPDGSGNNGGDDDV